VKLSGKQAGLWTRDKSCGRKQYGNSGAAADTRLRRTHEGHSENLRQLMLPLTALDLLPAVVALGYGDSELALRFSIVAVGTRAAGLLFPHCLLICTGLSQAQVRVFI